LAIRAESREGKTLSTLPNFTNANHAIGYAAECGEQDFIDTTPFFFAKVLFDYPGTFPAREQDLIDTTPRKRVSIFMMLTYFFCYYLLPEK
jgi:hypothetical protein